MTHLESAWAELVWDAPKIGDGLASLATEHVGCECAPAGGGRRLARVIDRWVVLGLLAGEEERGGGEAAALEHAAGGDGWVWGEELSQLEWDGC